ncbi:MAG: YitT family protein [Chloroflexota bacterium]
MPVPALLSNKNIKLSLDSLYIALGVVAEAIGLKAFLLPNYFIEGGVTGVSILASFSTGFKVSILLTALNLPFIILGWKQISMMFGIKSLCAILALAVSIHFIDLPTLTADKLLVSIFGGFFIGAGTGLAIRGGGALDGTEVLAIYLSSKTPFSIGGIIMAINIAIFSVAALVLGVESALYSILVYLISTKTTDFVVQGIEEYVGMMIISSKSEEIRRVITHKLSRGATILKAKRGLDAYSPEGSKIDIIFIVLTRLETSKVKNEVIGVDQNAFIIEQPISYVRGGMVKRLPLAE